jgi:oligopeptide transport system permease protein
MSIATRPVTDPIGEGAITAAPRSESAWALSLRSGRVVVGGGILLLILFLCVVTMPWTLSPTMPFTQQTNPLFYDRQLNAASRLPPLPNLEGAFVNETGEPLPLPAGARLASLFGYDQLGRSMLARCLLGGTISLAVGVAAATIAVVLGVSVGLIAGYRGGWVDSALMRLVDVLYGLPYILLVILFKVAFEEPLGRLLGWTQPHDATGGPAWFSPPQAANLVVLFSAIGLVSWLTMARVVRGQVLSLRGQPFVEAARAMGLPPMRIFMRHILPNLVGPITVYATLTVPQAILQESFLSFLGVGVNPPLPTWGSLASDAVTMLSPLRIYWWMLVFPCILLVVTLLSLNFMGDGLRDVFDPKRESSKI